MKKTDDELEQVKGDFVSLLERFNITRSKHYFFVK